jgi:hypothetical protein
MSHWYIPAKAHHPGIQNTGADKPPFPAVQPHPPSGFPHPFHDARPPIQAIIILAPPPQGSRKPTSQNSQTGPAAQWGPAKKPRRLGLCLSPSSPSANLLHRFVLFSTSIICGLLVSSPLSSPRPFLPPSILSLLHPDNAQPPAPETATCHKPASHRCSFTSASLCTALTSADLTEAECCYVWKKAGKASTHARQK